MKLFWSPRSPYVRKVLVVAHETGAENAIERIPMVIMSTQPNDELLALNPLGQIPTLITDTGQAIYDSAAICHYLDVVRAKGALHPNDPKARLDMERRHALGDGLTALLLGWLLERSRQQPDQSAMRIAAANKKLAYIFQALEAEIETTAALPFDVGHISIVAALGYLEFRFSKDWVWRERFPKLADWWQLVSERPSVKATIHFDELAAARDKQPAQHGSAKTKGKK